MTSLLRRYFFGVLGLAGALGLILVAVYVTGPGKQAGPDLSLSKASEKGLFRVMLSPDPGKIRQGQLHSWKLTLKTATGTPVEYAAIDVSGGMPKQIHGLPTSPQATDYLGKGQYRIAGVKFTAGGWWQLRFAISAAAGTDTVVFNVVL